MNNTVERLLVKIPHQHNFLDIQIQRLLWELDRWRAGLETTTNEHGFEPDQKLLH